TIAAATSTTNLYFKDLNPQTTTLTASSAGLSSSSLTVNVQSGSPTQLSLTGPSPLGTGSCGNYSVWTLDASNNPSAVSANTTITLSGNGAGFFYSDSGCTTAVSSVTIGVNNNTQG